MELIKERSTAKIPLVLIVVASLFLFARIIDLGVHLVASSESPSLHEASLKAPVWKQIPEQCDALPLQAAQPAARTTPEISPESQKQVDEIMAASQAQGKFVLYEFGADWSDPCKTMERTALSNAEIQNVISANFMPVRVTDKFKETGGRNPRLVSDLQKKFHVFAFPTLVIVDRGGKVAGILVGNCTSLTVYRFLTRVRHSLDHPA